jgi:hypothetical protein
MESMRFAVYYAPEPAHPLWKAGCRWLGRDPAQPAFLGSPHEAADEPRRYGFHATLKPPMALRAGATSDRFVDAVRALAARTPRFEMPALEVGTLGRFVALRPVGAVEAAHPLRCLADACVRELDDWRDAAGQDMQRRLADRSLSPTQKDLLTRWGYPHVFEHWRFHMTLSDTLPDDAGGAARRERICEDARRHFGAALQQPLACESVCIFTEPAEGQPFVLSQRLALAR